MFSGKWQTLRPLTVIFASTFGRFLLTSWCHIYFLGFAGRALYKDRGRFSSRLWRDDNNIAQQNSPPKGTVKQTEPSGGVFLVIHPRQGTVRDC